MADDSQTEEMQENADATETTGRSGETTDEVLVDLDSDLDQTQDVGELQAAIREQNDRIEELEDLVLDLSVRVADDKGMGVCPACHGPVQKVRRWIRPNTIECTKCGEVYHEY